MDYFSTYRTTNKIHVGEEKLSLGKFFDPSNPFPSEIRNHISTHTNLLPLFVTITPDFLFIGEGKERLEKRIKIT